LGERETRNLGETYVLGDHPPVLVTALQSSFEPDTTSSRLAVVPCPRIGEDGLYENAPEGRPIRVYAWLDVRLMLEDFS
jgi:hypothetical protein